MNMLFSPPAREIELRDYQIEAVAKLREGIRKGHRRQILAAPTGFGKTECAAHIIKQAMEKGSRAWFVVDRVTLVDQTSERFAGYGIDHGIIQADHLLTAPEKQVQIASAQTLGRRRISRLPDLIIIDEAHCHYRSTKKLVEQLESAKVIGLTATPFTAGMAEHWDGLVNGTTVNRLIEQGYLTPLRIKACVRPDMDGAKRKSTGEYDEDEAGQRGITIVGDVVQTWVEQTAKVFGGPVKTIVFSPSVAHGAELCRQFAGAGYNFQQLSYLDADDDSRREKVAEFRKADSAIDGLVSVSVLTKGFDVPDVMCGISCRPYTKSFSSHVQELGRVMRTSPGKEFGLWLDHSGNSIAFAEDTAWLYEHGCSSLSDAQHKDSETRSPTEKQKQKYFCGGCGEQLLPHATACHACGWERPRRGEIQTVEGTLVDFDLSISAAFQPRAGLRADCLRDPRGMWNAALCYCLANTSRGDSAARKWAFAIWCGIYPGSKLPYELYLAQPRHDTIREDQWGLIEREVKRFRKTNRRRAA